MNFSRIFIDRPIFAAVISIVIVIIGAIAYQTLPLAQYPEVAPPTIIVKTTYPGASPQVIAETVATPIEQEVNGVEDMLYMSSQSTSDGVMTLTITFKLGTDLDKAQVLVQNRVAIAEPKLPDDVRRQGITTLKSSPDLLIVVHLISPDDSYDQLYISNYAILQVRERLKRLEGVGDVNIYGSREYSMRIWLDPSRLTFQNLTTDDVVKALRNQNVQVAAGVIGQPPLDSDRAFQINVTAQGRLITPEEFEKIIVKAGADGRVVRPARRGPGGTRRAGLRREQLSLWQARGRHARAAASGFQRARDRAARSRDDEKPQAGFSQGPRLSHHLRSDRLHRRVGARGSAHDFRGRPARHRCRHGGFCSPGGRR